MNFDTIAAIATSSINGSISIIRVSGEQSLEKVSEIFFDKHKNPLDLNKVKTHTIHYGFIYNRNMELLDEVMVLVMKAPRSFTTEDVVEIQCHGGSLICQMILQTLVEIGVRIAQPGEFTKRAFLHGRLDLSQAESIMDVIQSKSKSALKHSLAQLRGNVKEKILNLREKILSDLAFLEAALDDPEHISLEDFPKVMKQHADELQKEILHLIENGKNGRIIREGINTVIVGKPNVGKSSFLNCILRENRAIVTDIPGTTRDTLEEELMIGNNLIRITDTAGIHDTDDRIEAIGIEKAKGMMKQADFVIVLLDAGCELTEDDISILQDTSDCVGVVLLNKSDLVPVITKEDVAAYTEKKILSFSAASGEGLDKLEYYINTLFTKNKVKYDDDIYITNARHKEALIDAEKSLRLLCRSIEDGMPEDLYSIDLYNAYEALGRIIGESVEDDLVDKIFKDFCMGK